MDTLITSSPITLKWVEKIKSEIKKRNSSLIYSESKYWFSFKSLETNRKVIYLQPQKRQIRLFTKLDLTFDDSLKPAPTSGSWADTFPSIFLIRSEETIVNAVKLIISSYELDLHL